MRWRPFRYRQHLYDLCHLDPNTVVYTQPAKGDRPERRYVVDVHYSHHCFTRGMKPEEPLDPELSYSDRVFDFGRWKLSLLLPDIVRALAQTKCYHTGKGNFFTIQVIDDAGNKAEYEVFFEAYVRREKV